MLSHGRRDCHTVTLLSTPGQLLCDVVYLMYNIQAGVDDSWNQPFCHTNAVAGEVLMALV